MEKIKLSILDQSPVRMHGTASDALKESLTLAQHAEKWGYYRYWVSEHHNTASLAGAAPEILIAHLAANTSRLRFGSGGIMLPNHSSLKVAENFRTLESLYPGRIDLGIGRAPGGDRLAATLLNPSNNFNEQDFIQQLIDLQHYFDQDNDYEKRFPSVQAIPLSGTTPDMWLLSSSGQSGIFAAHFGMGLAFAHFINPVGGEDAVAMYRSEFKASTALPEPQVNVGIFVLCAETQEKAEELQQVMDYQMLQIERGVSSGIVPFEYVKDIDYSEAELHRIHFNRKRFITGTPERVKSKLLALAEAYTTDELMLVTITHSFADRLKSYELLAREFGMI